MHRRVASLSLALALLGAAPVPSEITSLAYSSSEVRIDVTGRGTVTLSDIRANLGDAPLSSQMVGGDVVWLLEADLHLHEGARLELHGTSIGGDVDELRLKSANAPEIHPIVEVKAQWGEIHISHTRITSWDPAAGGPDTQPTIEGRAYIRVKSYLDEALDVARESRMDVLDSEICYLGFQGGEAYGLTWKVKAEEHEAEIFERVNVYGDVRNSRIHHNQYGIYSYGHEGGVWAGNEVHHNVLYGIDPHDDSDHLVIENNLAYGNGMHGIIASQRCDDVTIRNNVSAGNVRHGIMLHRKCDLGLIEGNTAAGNGHTGIAIYGSDSCVVRNNIVRGNPRGIRLSGGCYFNTIEDNLVEDSEMSFYCYKGSDKPNPGESGRPGCNQFMRNVCRRSGLYDVVLQDADSNRFLENIFEDSRSPVWRISRGVGNQFVNNVIPAGQVLDVNVDSASAEAFVVTDASIVEDFESGAFVRVYADIEAWFEDTGTFGNFPGFLGTTPRNVEFGIHCASGPRVTAPVALRNLGATPNLLNIVDIRVEPAGSGFSVAPVALPLTLAGGERSVILVEFDPGAAGDPGAKRASIELDFDDGSTVRTSAVTAIATIGTGAGHLAVTPSGLDFGVVIAGSAVLSRALALASSGGAGSSVLIESLTWTDRTQGFMLTPEVALPLSAPSGRTEEISIVFDPGLAGGPGLKSTELVIGFWDGSCFRSVPVPVVASVRQRAGFVETDGLLVFDAEHFESSTPSATHQWDLVTTPAGFAGEGAMLAAPDDGERAAIEQLAESPRMDYAMVLSGAGEYFFWYRSSATDVGGDSFYAAVGSESAVQCGTESNASYAWRRGTITVREAGLQTLRVWMREDGLTLDKFILTADSNLLPTGIGPPESPRSGEASVAVSPLAVGESLGLREIRPNPFQTMTEVRFELPREAWVSLDVFSVTGRHVRALARGVRTAGSHAPAWNGRDDGGALVSAGVYFVRLETLGLSATRTLVRLP